MIEKIIGIKSVDFTPQGGEPIKGFSLFVTETNPDDKNLFGVIATKHWVKPKFMATTMQTSGLNAYRDAIGREITIFYNNEHIPTKTSLTPLEKRRQASQFLDILR